VPNISACFDHQNRCSFPAQALQTIRYQTELYDERVNNYRIFSEEEQEFLQYYYLVWQWPEFCKSKELFWVIDVNQAHKEAEKVTKLWHWKRHIVLYKCQCITGIDFLCETVASAVPWDKGETKLALSFDEVRNTVYQFETTRYFERFSQSPLVFNCYFLSFRVYLDSEQKEFYT
jgi:hypothetical protein